MERKYEALLFDLDGTLFRTETLAVAAYHATFEQLRAEGLFNLPTPPERVFLGSLGLLLDEIWRRVIPQASHAVRERANELLLYHEDRLLEEGRGEMYDGVESTLRELHRRGYKLFVASNGLEGYVKGVIQKKGLADVFTGLYSAGEYLTSTKAELVALALEHHAVTTACMCGDRKNDVEAGKQNGLFVVGCDYAGFHDDGELRDADLVIHSFPELLNHFQ